MQLVQPLNTLRTPGGYQVSISNGDEVLVQLNNAEVLRITMVGGNMKIKTPGTLTLEANNVEITANANVTVKAGNMLDLRGSGPAALKASGTLTLGGATVNVNNGALEVT